MGKRRPSPGFPPSSGESSIVRMFARMAEKNKTRLMKLTHEELNKWSQLMQRWPTVLIQILYCDQVAIFSQASFILLATPFPVQFIKKYPTVSVSPQSSHRPLLCNFTWCR